MTKVGVHIPHINPVFKNSFVPYLVEYMVKELHGHRGMTVVLPSLSFTFDVVSEAPFLPMGDNSLSSFSSSHRVITDLHMATILSSLWH